MTRVHTYLEFSRRQSGNLLIGKSVGAKKGVLKCRAYSRQVAADFSHRLRAALHCLFQVTGPRPNARHTAAAGPFLDSWIMAGSAKVVEALLEKHGRTFSQELGIKLESNMPSALFRWLCASLLFSARISNKIAMEAARALTKCGWTSAQKMAAATWKERTVALNRAGYARYDEKTSRMLADTSELLLDRYRGDLRKLREVAERDPRRERELIMECKGIGEVGASIFFREVQAIWPEHIPFADKAALRSASKLGLPTSAEGLAKLVSKKEFPRLLAALVRCSLAKDHAAIRGM